MNESLFFSLGHASATTARSVADSNQSRPHSALGYATPTAYAAQLAATADRLRAAETLRRSPVASSARAGQVHRRAPASAGSPPGITAHVRLRRQVRCCREHLAIGVDNVLLVEAGFSMCTPSASHLSQIIRRHLAYQTHPCGEILSIANAAE